MHFKATLESSGKQAAGMHVPQEVMDGLGGGRVPKVRVTIGRAHVARPASGSSTVAR